MTLYEVWAPHHSSTILMKSNILICALAGLSFYEFALQKFFGEKCDIHDKPTISPTYIFFSLFLSIILTIYHFSREGVSQSHHYLGIVHISEYNLQFSFTTSKESKRSRLVLYFRNGKSFYIFSHFFFAFEERNMFNTTFIGFLEKKNFN